MEDLKAYRIGFKGLADGLHNFEFRVSGEFFEAFELEDWQEADLLFKVVLEKKSTIMELDVVMEGLLRLPCDRCNVMMDVPMTTQENWVVKFGSQEEDGIIVLSEEEHELDMSHIFYEAAVLAAPKRVVHEEGECDTRVLEILEYRQERDKEDTDPRWDALKALKNDLKNR